LFCELPFQLLIFSPYFFTEDRLSALKSRDKEQEAELAKPEPTTEVLFLCSYEGCGKTFVDAGALRKHAHVHGERQYVCHYAGCDKVLPVIFLACVGLSGSLWHCCFWVVR
jgi:hypothetical protein